ncbi:MAG: aminotransferase class V-fold PLP-dependent enzyme [Rhodothermales bacterium]
MLASQKHLFSLPDDVHYLNCAYMAPLSRRVEAAGIAGIQYKRNPTTIEPASFFEESDTARRLFAELIHAEAQRIALIPAASYGIATAAANIHVRRGHNLVVVHEQFPSNVYTWKRLAAQTGAELRTVAPPDGTNRGARWNERILDAINADTAVVSLGHVHWADGTRFDLARIGERARDVDACFVVDATQSVGALPFDVRQIRPDALICAGYKWLLGPYSIGVAYFGPRFDHGVPLEENWITRLHSENFGGLVQYQDAYHAGAIRYDVGERSNFILVPMLVTALKHLHEWGIANIQAYCAELTGGLLHEARRLGFVLEDETWRSAHLFGVRVPPHLPMNRLKKALAERNVAVSMRGDAIRISPNVYNDTSDMEALHDAFLSCMEPSPRL